MVKQWKRSLSGADVQAEAEDALEKDIANLSPATNSVADNLDGGVASVDWSNKTPKMDSGSASNGTVFEISGSGYILDVRLLPHDPNAVWEINADGTELWDEFEDSLYLSTGGTQDLGNNDTTTYINQFSTKLRFDTSFKILETADYQLEAQVNYVLD